MIYNIFLQVGRVHTLVLALLVLLTGCTQDISSRSFKFIYSVNLESSNGKKIELWLPIPQSNEVQIISNLSIDSDELSYKIKNEKIYNNKYLYIYSHSGTTSDKTVTMAFDVKRLEHQNIKYIDVNPSDYLSASSMVPTDGIFTSIIKKNKLNKNDKRSLYDFVLSGMHYAKPTSTDNKYYKDPWLNASDRYGIKKVSRDKVLDLYQSSKKTKGTYAFGNGNSLYACDIGVGNCTDYHSYFISLSRTMDIPSRFHMGFYIPNGKEGTVEGYHCWADYYVKDKGWYPVDISEADQDLEKIDYFFGNVCSNRVAMMIGRDFILKGYESETTNLFIYPILEVNDNNSFAFNKSFSYKSL